MGIRLRTDSVGDIPLGLEFGDMHYQVKRGETMYGPYTLAELQRYRASENVLGTDLVKSDEMPGWLTVTELLTSVAQAPVDGIEASLYGAPADVRTAEFPWFPVTPLKFAVMSVCTFGLYHVFWCYKNWEREESRSKEGLMPWARAIFLGIWNFSLFSRVQASAKAKEMTVGWSPVFLGVLVLVFAGVGRIRMPFALLSLLSFVAYMPVVNTIAQMNGALAESTAEKLNGSFSGLNIGGIVVGGILLFFAFLGAFMPGLAAK